MINKYRKYYFENEEDWHTYEIGTYHVSAVGNSHKDLNPHDHSGPCLRATYFDYIHPIENDDKSEGNFHIGRILHKVIQEIYKINVPNSIIEFPIVLEVKKGITIKGSVDIIDLDEKSIPDIKTASLFTFPTSEYDYSPTHVSQTSIYSALLQMYVFKETFFKPKILRVIYTKKHNLETVEVDLDVNEEDVAKSYDDFVARVIHLDECLREKKIPDAEPMKWCKFCPRLSFCIEKGYIKLKKDSKGKAKKGWYVLNDALVSLVS